MSDLNRGAHGLLGFALAALSGCGTAGELGQGYFEYQCIDASDPTCGGLDFSPDIPTLIAQSARARVAYDPTSDSTTFEVTPAAPLLASVQDGAIVFHEPGEIALLARRGGKVADFVHVRISVIDHLSVTGGEELSLSEGQEAQIRVTPVGPTEQALAGALAYSWVSKDPQIADVIPVIASDKATIEGKAPGSTTITVSVGSVSKDITVSVGGAQ